MKKIKYSIVLPTLNSLKYLPTCVETIISQNYNDYELIISNNCSDDGTEEYLYTLKTNPQVRIIRPEKRLPLGEHWDFAISHAKGEWVYGIGSDDGVLPYFFKLLDKLTAIADTKSLNIIKTNRVYYFWNGVQDVHRNAYISFSAKPDVQILSCKKILYEVLYEKPDNFFDIPQMYTTSVFRNSVLEKVKNTKNNKVIQTGISHDIYLGVLGCVFEEQYLYANIPIGWVGTSAKSYGLCEGKTIPDFESLKVEVKNNLEKYCGKFVNHYSILPFGNSYLEYGILIFLKNKDGYNISLPDDFNLLKRENQIKFYACIYKSIMKIKDKIQREQRVFFLDVLLEYNGIKRDEVISVYKQNASTDLKLVVLLKSFMVRTKRKMEKAFKNLFFENSFKGFRIEQLYGEPDIFMDMLAVNEYIKKSSEIETMINSLKCKL